MNIGDAKAEFLGPIDYKLAEENLNKEIPVLEQRKAEFGKAETALKEK